MSKRAEEAALEAYPRTYSTVKRHAKRVQSGLVDTHKPVRSIFQQGYDQAVSDVLSWLDSNMTLGPGDTSGLKSEIKAHFL